MGYKIVSTNRANKSDIENLVRDSVIKLLNICNVDLVIDVGAHIGQYGNELRIIFTGRPDVQVMLVEDTRPRLIDPTFDSKQKQS